MFDLHFYQSLLLTLLYVHLTFVSYEIYLHRGIIHNGIKFSKTGALVFELWLWLSVSLPDKYFLCSHQMHHAYADTKLDLHGPTALGLKEQFLLVPIKQIVNNIRRALLMRSNKSKFPTSELQKKFLKKFLTNIDDYQHTFFTKTSRYGNFSFLMINLLLFGLTGVVVYVLFVAITVISQNILVDGLGHYYGYSNYQTDNKSKNIFPVGILFGGAELHNNHHRYPNAKKLDIKWYEFDISWWYIRILTFFKLCK
jgi:stearoyl-CoA desaturase (delta-9 desaturase)